MKYLQPIILTEGLWTPIETSINKIFDKAIFRPLLDALRELGIEIRNARPNSLERAIVEGNIYYENGRIYGTFNSTLSKELRGIGAIHDRRDNSWRLPEGVTLPARLHIAIADAEAKTQKAIDTVIRTLGDVDLNAAISESDLREQYGTGAWRINHQFVEVTKMIAIAPEFTQAMKDTIAKEWSQNLELYIKGWADEAILELRQKVQSNSLRGHRSGNLVKMIQETQGASKTKAKFLARQETSLLMSKMREQRYTEIGLDEYKWTGVNDARERPDHKMLNGRIFKYSNPPVTNQQTGARNNPGEDYGCRCIAVPVFREQSNG